MANISSINRYPAEHTYFGWGTAGALGIHLFLAAAVLLIAWLSGIKSIEQLMKESGSPAINAPPPEEQIEIEIKDELPPPPPVMNPEFAVQVMKPVPPPPKPVIKKLEVPKPKPVRSAPAVVSRLVVGSENFPQPGYPTYALMHHESGTAMIRIQFDGEGAASDVDLVSSSGHSDLDDNAVYWIRNRWHDSSYANSSATVPIAYTLR